MYSKEDQHSLHRYKADQAFLVGQTKTPVGAYLDVDDMVRIAVEHGVDAIHPGYGFLSENVNFARACANAGVVFVGPPPDVLDLFGDKTKARNLALSLSVPVIPGTADACLTVEDARRFIDKIGARGATDSRSCGLLNERNRVPGDAQGRERRRRARHARVQGRGGSGERLQQRVSRGCAGLW